MKWVLIHEADFSGNDPLSNFALEGPGETFLDENNATLNMRSIYQRDIYYVWSNLTDSGTNNIIVKNSDINGPLEDIAKQKTPELYKNFVKGGKFKGGHVVLWMKKRFPNNIIIEFDMKSVDPLGLFILFFSASPKKNTKGSIFDEVPQRNGLYSQYTGGKINNFGLSYSARYTGNPRGECRLRKNTGFKSVAKGPDYAAEETGIWYSIKVIKNRKVIKFFIDNTLVLEYKASNKKGMLKGGYIGFRQMATAWGKYKNIKVFRKA